MPNWCSNSATLSGPLDKIKALWDAAQGNDSGLFMAMVPMGKWDYDQAISQWGTKWDVSVENMTYEASADGKTASITGFFDTAWAPPREAFESWCDNNEDCFAELEYFEPGAGYVGRWDSHGEDEEYDIDPENLEEIPEDLREAWDLDTWYEDLNEDEESEESDEAKDIKEAGKDSGC